MRFMVRHALTGVMAGWTVLLLLLNFDIGGLGALIDRSASPDGWTAAMALLFGSSFGMIGIVWGVLVLLPDEE
jgi:hypothetical protein